MECSVVVVGAGPVGLTMAAELARYGVKLRVIDKAPHRSETSKALVLWPRSLELIDRMGCGSTFDQAGLKVDAASFHSGTKQIGQVRFGSVASPHPYALMIPQSDTERLLEEHLNSLGVEVERQVELTGFVATEDKVTLSLRRGDGAVETLDTDWLTGCDGAHSSVRHLLGKEFVGDTLPSDWILADVHLTGVTSPISELDLYWHSEGTLVLFPIEPGRYRIVADLPGSPTSKDHPEPTLAEVQALLDQRGPGGVVASDPVWLSRFRINERKVSDYRSGRVFLAGDAAHVHSPAGGQGMNTGIQDACNLAWKLSLVCLGICGAEPLLSSYSEERSPIATQVLAETGRATSLAVLKGSVLQSIRDHVAQLLLGLGPVRRKMVDVITEVSIGYPQGSLVGPKRGHHHDSNPGVRAPIRSDEAPFGAGDHPRFALCSEFDDASTRLITRFPDLLEPSPRQPFDSDSLTLVRPDGYIGFVASREAWGDLENYLDTVAGKPSNGLGS